MFRSNSQGGGWLPVVRSVRRGGRARLNRLLTGLGGTREPIRHALAAPTSKILVVRVNKRLGNILFLTPMLHALHTGLPRAAIDVFIRDARQAPLLGSLPGVRQVYAQPSSLRGLVSLLSELRGRRYDLAIDPSFDSTGGRTVMALSAARQRLGFAGPGQWLRLTHAAGHPVSEHQAEQAVELLASGISGIEFGCWPHLGVHPGKAARIAAERHWAQALGSRAAGPVIGFFTNATGRKRLSDDWWRAWLAAVRTRVPVARLLEIYPPGAIRPLQPELAGVQIDALEVLSAFLARLGAFAAADCGVMHLAAASGVPTVGLFKATSPADYAPLGPRCVSIEMGDLTPDHAAHAAVERLTPQ